jgi:hypothetical protein
MVRFVMERLILVGKATLREVKAIVLTSVS